MPDFQTGDWVSFVIVGVMAAFFVGYIMRGRGFGWFGNLLIGVIGALLGPFLYGFLPTQFKKLDSLPSINLGQLLIAMIGAFVFLLLVSAIKKRKTLK